MPKTILVTVPLEQLKQAILACEASGNSTMYCFEAEVLNDNCAAVVPPGAQVALVYKERNENA